MRLLTLAGTVALLTTIVAMLAAAGGAAAARPEIVKKGGGSVAGDTFNFTSAETELKREGETVIKCKKDKGTGEVKSAKELTASIDLERCNIASFAIQSLGDKNGVILLSKLPGELCYIDAATKEVGVLLALPAAGLHVESPSLGALLVIEGSLVGSLTPVDTLTSSYTLTFSNPDDTCAGSVAPEDEVLIEVEHNGETLPATVTGAESLTFKEEVEVLA